MGGWTLWRRMLWVVRGYTREDDTRDRERRLRLARLTGLHGTYFHAGKCLSDEEVIALQSRKIRGLEMQRAQQERGHQRKVRKLQAQIAALRPIPTQEPER